VGILFEATRNFPKDPIDPRLAFFDIYGTLQWVFCNIFITILFDIKKFFFLVEKGNRLEVSRLRFVVSGQLEFAFDFFVPKFGADARLHGIIFVVSLCAEKWLECVIAQVVLFKLKVSVSGKLVRCFETRRNV
jgi:hypothetical protein